MHNQRMGLPLDRGDELDSRLEFSRGHRGPIGKVALGPATFRFELLLPADHEAIPCGRGTCLQFCRRGE